MSLDAVWIRSLPVAAALVAAACSGGGSRCALGDIHLYRADGRPIDERGEIHIGDEIDAQVEANGCADTLVFRWLSTTLRLAQAPRAGTTARYTAVTGGQDEIVLEVLDRERLVARATRRIWVVPRAPEAQLAAAASTSTMPPAASSSSVRTPEEATIRITQIPPYDPAGGDPSRADVAGEVTGGGPGQRVVLYACTDICYVQPLITTPFTDVVGGRWRNWTHTGRVYVALLVTSGFQPPARIATPQTELAGVVARHVVDGAR
jgi:hypothetical protein